MISNPKRAVSVNHQVEMQALRLNLGGTAELPSYSWTGVFLFLNQRSDRYGNAEKV